MGHQAANRAASARASVNDVVSVCVRKVESRGRCENTKNTSQIVRRVERRICVALRFGVGFREHKKKHCYVMGNVSRAQEHFITARRKDDAADHLIRAAYMHLR